MPEASTDTLLTIFIGLVALALLGIAVSVAVVAWYVVRFVRELEIIARRLHEAGEIVAGDLQDLRLRTKGSISSFMYQISKTLWHKKR